MALQWKDRVLETSTTAGTGNFTLAGAVAGFQTFAAVSSVSDTMYYFIEAINSSGVPTGEWEVGLGTYSGANTLTRTTVHASSNAGAAVNFSAGTKRVGIAFTATAASNIPNTPSGNIAATTVQAAINELDSEKVAKAGDTMTGPLTVTGDAKALIVRDNSGPQTSFMLRVSGAVADEKDWEFLSNSGGDFQLRAINDAYSAAQTALRFIRGAGATVNMVEFFTGGATRLQVDSTGNFQMGGANTVIDSNRLHRLRQYTVATLPTVGTAGRLAAVTDASAPTYNATVAGGGAVNIPVYDNGSNWTCH